MNNFNNFNLHYAGCQLDEPRVRNRPDLKLTAEMYVKLQMEYLLSRTTNMKMSLEPGHKYPFTLDLSIQVDNQIISFLDAWCNSKPFYAIGLCTVDLVKLGMAENESIELLGFTEMKPWVGECRNNGDIKWYDELKVDDTFEIRLFGNLILNSPHFSIITDNFVNVISSPEEEIVDDEIVDDEINRYVDGQYVDVDGYDIDEPEDIGNSDPDAEPSVVK